MAKGPTTARANPGEINLDDEIDAGGGDLDLRLEGDDAPDPSQARSPRREDDDERDERKPSDLKYEADPRDALFARIADRRAEQGQELSTEEEDDEAEEIAEENGEETDPEVLIVAGPGAREVNRPQETKPAPRKVTDLQDDDLVIVKVDGAEIEMRYGDMKARAQKDVAADSRLEQAKALLAEVRELRNTAAAPANEQRPGGRTEPDNQAPQADAKTKADRAARLAEIVDKLQTEAPEKAAEALEGLISELSAQGNTSPSDVESVVRRTVADEESERAARVEIGTSFSAVSETFGDILSDARLATMAFEDTVASVVKTLRDAGTPEEDFQSVADAVARRNAAEPDPSKHDSFGLAILREYAKVARDPVYKLKPVKTLMEDGLRATRKWRTGDDNVPVNDKGKALTPAAGGDGNGNRGQGAGSRPRVVLSTNRSERKAGVSVQPRSASMRSDFSATGPTVRKNPSKTIAEMAEQRR